ncbi:MAG: hypothetical protein ACHQT8_03535 [Chlamydiales bacterium]
MSEGVLFLQRRVEGVQTARVKKEAEEALHFSIHERPIYTRFQGLLEGVKEDDEKIAREGLQ